MSSDVSSSADVLVHTGVMMYEGYSGNDEHGKEYMEMQRDKACGSS